MALKIYGVARSRAIRTLWMAEELDIPYEHVPVTPGAGPNGSRTPEFLAVNPNGHVPAIDDDGTIIVESLAINLHLAHRYGGPLSPKDVSEDGRMTMWGFWAATEVEPHAVQAMYNRIFYPPENRSERDVTAALAALEAPMAVLDSALAAGGGYLVGKRFTVADLNMASVLFYLRVVPDFVAKFPHAKAMYEAAMARPAAQRAFAMRGPG